jgi:transcriptional regulator with GAF, ATPase, and Fis domain
MARVERLREQDAAIEATRAALERWQVSKARAHGERARASAASHGDARGVALADVLLARAALLTCAEPRADLLLAPGIPEAWADDAVVTGAVERFEAELASALQSNSVSRSPVIAAGSPVDRVVALALARVRELGVRRPVSRARTGMPVEFVDAGGWQHVLAGAESEAAGTSGAEAIELALFVAERDGLLALRWCALELKLASCERRAASHESSNVRERLRELAESWALTLPEADALGALARADRATLSSLESNEPATSLASTLVDVAAKMAHERDTARLVDIALDGALALTDAERGLLLLGEGDGQKLVAARHVEGRSDYELLLGLSSTIARRALKNGELIVADDVRRDPRFSECASVALDVKSVLCIPIHARDQIEGALYLDRRSRGRSFAADAVAAARAIGTLLASALLSARTIADLEARGREVEAAREELSLALATRTAERDDIGRRLARLEDVTPAGPSIIVGSSTVMRRLRRLIETVGASDVPVLIAGETGSGKELIARAVHTASSRRDRPFVAVNCGALSETLLAAELFGTTRGAYTGAGAARPGLFEAAHRGTLFLDEVGDMPAAMQTALLRVLESGEVRPVGSVEARRIDVRVVAASHRDLVELVQQRSFRDDLRYRLEVVRIEAPPLRAHLEDLPELCDRLIQDVRKQYALPERRLSGAALETLRLRRFPGNVRELRHVLANAALTAEGASILPSDLPPERNSESPRAPASEHDHGSDIDGHALRAESIRRALRATAGHRGQAAKLLGISRSTLYRYCGSYGIDLGPATGP